MIFTGNWQTTRESISFDAESFNRTEERLNLLNHLKAKYGGSIEKVLSYKKEKEERLEELEHYEAYRLRLKKELETKRAELLSACAKVSAIRKKRRSSSPENYGGS